MKKLDTRTGPSPIWLANAELFCPLGVPDNDYICELHVRTYFAKLGDSWLDNTTIRDSIDNRRQLARALRFYWEFADFSQLTEDPKRLCDPIRKFVIRGNNLIRSLRKQS